MAQSKRIAFVDVAKGIAIIAIIAGHLGFAGPDGIDWVSRFVFEFHVPVFFIISGYFLSSRQPLGEFVRAKAWRMLAPYAFTCVMIFVALVVLKCVNGYSQPPSIFPGLRTFVVAALYGAGSPGAMLPDGVMHIGAIWFLEALLVALIEVRVCRMAGKAEPFIVAGLFALSVWSAQYIWLPLNLQSGCVGGLYVTIGTLLRQREYLRCDFSPAAFALMTAVVVAGCILGLNVSIVRANMGRWFLGLPVSIVASLWCLSLAQLIEGNAKHLTAVLDFFGKNSLVVLSMHLFLLDVGFKHLLIALGVPTDNNVLFFVNLVCQLGLSALFVRAAGASRILRKVFY